MSWGSLDSLVRASECITQWQLHWRYASWERKYKPSAMAVCLLQIIRPVTSHPLGVNKRQVEIVPNLSPLGAQTGALRTMGCRFGCNANMSAASQRAVVSAVGFETSRETWADLSAGITEPTPAVTILQCQANFAGLRLLWCWGRHRSETLEYKWAQWM